MPIKVIFRILLSWIFVFTFIGNVHAQQEVELDGREYVATLHKDADKVQSWLDSAKKAQETTKISELNKRAVELRAILSMMDAMIAVKKKELFDMDGFSKANERFNRTFREADLIARLGEDEIAAMKKVDDEQLLNQDVGAGEGAYTTERLMYDNANTYVNPDSSAENE